MSDSTESKYGGGFAARMIFLLIVLGLVVACFFYDKQMIADADQKVGEAFNLLTVETDDGGGIPKDLVKEKLGQEPSDQSSQDGYDVETYTFNRALPVLMKQRFITVVYQGGGLVQIFDSKPFDIALMKDTYVPKPEKIDPSRLPSSALSGPAPPSGGDDDKEDDKEKDRPAADGDDEADAPAEDKAEDKADDKEEAKADDKEEAKADDK